MRDHRAFEQLFAEHGRDVLGYALRRTDQSTAEDVVAEVLAIAWRRLERIPDREPVLWLYAVARRVLANQRRAGLRRDALGQTLAALADRQPSCEASSNPRSEQIRAALLALGRADREVLMLTAWEGLDGRQAATVLGCSTGALHTRLHRARRRLEAALERSSPLPSAVRSCPDGSTP